MTTSYKGNIMERQMYSIFEYSVFFFEYIIIIMSCLLGDIVVAGVIRYNHIYLSKYPPEYIFEITVRRSVSRRIIILYYNIVACMMYNNSSYKPVFSRHPRPRENYFV